SFLMALGPHPQHELSLMLPLGFARPRARMAAGATSFLMALGPSASSLRARRDLAVALAKAGPLARAVADAPPRIRSSSARMAAGATFRSYHSLCDSSWRPRRRGAQLFFARRAFRSRRWPLMSTSGLATVKHRRRTSIA